MRILIVKTSSMGDVVHALPAITDIAQALPQAQIDWLVERSFASIPALHPAVQQVLPLAWRKWRKSLRQADTRLQMRQWWAELRAQPYDLVLDLQGLVKSAVFACCARGPRAGYDRSSIREPVAALFYQRRFQVSRELHAITRCRLLAARALGYADPTSPPNFGLDGLRRVPLNLDGLSLPYAVLIPCASRVEKLWPEADWIALARQLSEQGLRSVVMWGSDAELARAQSIAQAVDGWVPPFLSVAEAAPLLAGAAVIVGLDTGLTHLGAACGRPTLGIYCDHEPGLTGVTGSARVISFGGKGQVPALLVVQDGLHRLLQA